jgi:hypothetical protein
MKLTDIRDARMFAADLLALSAGLDGVELSGMGRDIARAARLIETMGRELALRKLAARRALKALEDLK